MKAAQFQDNAGAGLELQTGSNIILTDAGTGPLGLDIVNIGTVNDATLNSSGADIQISSPAGASLTAENSATVSGLITALGSAFGDSGTLLVTQSAQWSLSGDMIVGDKGER